MTAAFVVASLLLALLAVGMLTRPLWRRAPPPSAEDAAALAPLREQQRQLEALHASGALDDAAFHAAREKLERRVVDAVFAAEPCAAAAWRPTGQRRLALGVSALVLAVAGSGYAWLGTPRALRGGAEAPVAAAPQDGARHSITPEQIEAMIDKLAARLAAQPDDPEGWTMLGRSYLVLGRHPQAVEALRHALERRPNDAGLLVDTADAIAMANDRKLEGEPAQLVAKALQIEPDNAKALSLAGSIAFDRSDFAGALRHWERVQRVAPDSELARQMQEGIDEARARLGGAAPPPATAAAPANPPAPVPAAAAAGNASVSGTVTLSPALAAQAKPDDTVFVFARAAEGPRMPLAILRKQVKDLPLTFTLDDSQAMSAAAKLSSAPRVVVGARVSKGGSATAQPGDLQGFSQPVAPGATQLKIEIAEVVR